MSGPIQQKMGAALKVISRARSAGELNLQPDKNLSNLENALLLESQLEKVQKEGRTLEIFLEDIRESSSAWTDLLRKFTATERDAGEADFAAFDKKEKINDKIEAADTKLRDLRDLAGKLTVQAKLYRSRANNDERDAQAAHEKARQQNANAPHSNALPFTAPLYQFQPIQLEKFSGHKRKWPEFYESYKSAIGSQPISKAEKFNFLRNMLVGEARDLIAGFRLEDSNYDVAVQLLKDTYGAPEEHIRALHFELANLKTCRTLRGTKEFLLQLERLTRELNNAGEDIDGPPTFLMLEKKLTPSFLRTILNKKGEDPANWTTTKFRSVLSDAVRRETQIQEVMGEYGHPPQGSRTTQPITHAQPQWARWPTAKAFQGRYQSPPREHTYISPTVDKHQRQMDIRPPQGQPQCPKHRAEAMSGGLNQIPEQRDLTFISSSVDEHHKRLGNKPPQRKPQPTVHWTPSQPELQWPSGQQTQPTVQQEQNPFTQHEPTTPCVFCGSKHWHNECRQFSTFQQRLDIVREKHLCFKCLKPNHRAHECLRPSKCYKCRRPHPTALCRNDNNVSTQFAAAASDQSKRGSESSNGIGTKVMPQQCNARRDDESRALLMTTTSTVFNPERPHLKKSAVIFIDPGSHRSFVTSKTANQLDLPVVHTEECHLTTFGKQKPKKFVSDLVKIGFLGNGGEKLIFNLNALNFLVNEMPVITLSALDNTQLRQRKLAVPHRDIQPDIMLGMDVWHDLSVQQIERLPSGFTLSQSTIGTILSGSGLIDMGQEAKVTFILSAQDQTARRTVQPIKAEPLIGMSMALSETKADKHGLAVTKQEARRTTWQLNAPLPIIQATDQVSDINSQTNAEKRRTATLPPFNQQSSRQERLRPPQQPGEPGLRKPVQAWVGRQKGCSSATAEAFKRSRTSPKAPRRLQVQRQHAGAKQNPLEVRPHVAKNLPRKTAGSGKPNFSSKAMDLRRKRKGDDKLRAEKPKKAAGMKPRNEFHAGRRELSAPTKTGKNTTTPSSQGPGFRPDTHDYRSFKFNPRKHTLGLANNHRRLADKPVRLIRLQISRNFKQQQLQQGDMLSDVNPLTTRTLNRQSPDHISATNSPNDSAEIARNVGPGPSSPKVEQINNIMDHDPDSISLAGSDDERDLDQRDDERDRDQSAPATSTYKIPRKKDIVFKKQRHFLGRNWGLHAVQQKPSDNDPSMGLLYAPRPKGKKLFFKDGSLKRLLELTTLFRRGKGVQTAKELLEQHGKIPMKDWAAKEQQITAELLEQEEKRHKKSRDKQQKRSKQQASEQLMLQRLFGDSPEQAPEQTTTTEAEDKESRFQHNEKRIKWYNHRQAAVDELRRKMKLKKKQQAPAAIEEDINEPRKEDEQHLQKLIKDGSKEAQRALEASKQLTLRQQSQQRMHHKPLRRASDLPKNGEKLLDFCKRLYGDHLESAWKRQRAFKEMQEILESNEFKLYHVNGQQATIQCFLANQHELD
uniref:CCHC-type domain-containing protein n=1 Tax=Globodera rostochiensis TaxID=31243 RepID=A0A914H300_GLORO